MMRGVCGAAAALLGLAVMLTAAADASARPTSVARDGRPNILVVMTDDQALDDVQHMPNVERLLARRGTSFADAVDSFPLSCPARATFITGQYAHNHGVAGNFYPYGWQGMKGKANTLPVWLHRSGYTTAMIGKWLNGYGAINQHEVPKGFDTWRGLLDLSAYDYFNFLMNANGVLRSWGDGAYARALVKLARVEASPGWSAVPQVTAWPPQPSPPCSYRTAHPADYSPDVTGKTTEHLVRAQAHSRKPFFIWWAPAAPHREDVDTSILGRAGPDPRPTPRYARLAKSFRLPRTPSFNEPDMAGKPRLIHALPSLTAAQIDQLQLDYEGRIGSLRAVDDHVARLIGILRHTRQLGNTLIVFLSDNGWLEGQHRIPGDKFVPYEESIHVPLILRGPGIRAGRTVRTQVSNIDFAPTLLRAAHAHAGRPQDGISLLSVARGATEAPARAIGLEATGPLFFAEGFPMGYDQPSTGLRTQRYKYVVWSYGDRELYDLRRDPYELHNVVDNPAYSAEQARLARDLRLLRRCRGRNCHIGP